MVREITIKPALNGFYVRVGCQTLVFTSIEVLIQELALYLKNPDHVEKIYIETSINSKHLLGQPEQDHPVALAGGPEAVFDPARKR